MKLIALTGKEGAGKYAIVDKEGYIKAMRATKSWALFGKYARGMDRSTKKMVMLHRLIMDNPSGIVDHINGNPLDCRRSNLRVVTASINALNRSAKRPGHLGIQWDKRRNTWSAYITKRGKYVNLGRFSDKDDARRKYRDAALAMDPLLAIRHKEEWKDL